MEQFELIVSECCEGDRLDSFLAGQESLNLSRSGAQHLIEKELVLCDGNLCAKNTRLKSGQRIVVQIPDAVPPEAVAQNIPLNIIYEDDHLLVVNKPKGMVVHPAAGNPDGTLVNALLYHCGDHLSKIGGAQRPGIVHRIDKDTSGLLVAAKDDITHEGLSRQMAVHSIQRIYHAVIYGKLREPEGYVEAPIGRSKNDRKKMGIVEDGKYAYTAYKQLAAYQGFTYIQCQLKTGRTHQIRVHMASLGHPLAGDSVYGPRNCINQLNGQCLHAKTLGFVHPITGQELLFNSELPQYFSDFLCKLGKEQ